jgi:hypothetical protein
MVAVTKPLMDWEHDQAEVMKPETVRIESERKKRVAQIDALRKKAAHGKDNSVNFVNEIREIADLEADLPEVPKAPRLDPRRHPREARLHDGRQRRVDGRHQRRDGIFDILAGRYSNGVPNLDLFLQAISRSRTEP